MRRQTAEAVEEVGAEEEERMDAEEEEGGDIWSMKAMIATLQMMLRNISMNFILVVHNLHTSNILLTV